MEAHTKQISNNTDTPINVGVLSLYPKQGDGSHARLD